jgi:hypothetical protein
MGIDSAGVTPAPAKRTALTRLPEKSNTGITNINDYYVLENPGIPLPFRIQTNSLKVLDLKFKVLDEII